MASRSTAPSAPVTFDLPLDLLTKIETCRKNLQLGNASEVIRAALENFDFAACEPEVTPHRQISVRLSAEQRAMLKRYARLKDVSVGELLRLAVDALPVARAAKPRKAARVARR
jgi:Arc/MetJ-type ribon-helix-helix transcriptional regulator